MIYLLTYSLAEFLGRAEIRVQKVWMDSGGRLEPHLLRLDLQEVKSGQVILKLSIQLFEKLSGPNVQSRKTLPKK